MTFGAAAEGDLLVDRYRLEEHIDTDSVNRQIWRGIDVVLRRPVALVIRQPGGEAAVSMLTTAVAASRLVHPHLVSVYDAIDEGHRAYLVREWVPGIALRDVLREAPLDAERSILVTHAVAEAVAALHAAGITHGNIHPGTILIADDGRVVLADAHAEGPSDAAADVRALGAVLYASLTGLWPHLECGPSVLPDAPRDGSGRLASPRQVRGGIPPHLDEIANDLLNGRGPTPTAAALAGEFARLATQGGGDFDDDAGPMGFVSGGEVGGGRRRSGGKIALGVTLLAAIAVVGGLLGVRMLGRDNAQNPNTPSGSSAPATSAPASANGSPVELAADQVRIVDPPGGDRQEFAGYQRVVDGNGNTGWETAQYNQAKFGGLKPGMGVLINLGKPTDVEAVRVVVGQTGATLSLRTGARDPGDTSAGDQTINKEYTQVGQALEGDDRTTMVFPVPDEQPAMQYVLVWITQLPRADNGKFQLSVNEITVLAVQ
jgi:hypothetical protein